jgi:hypothetical protein
LLGNWKTLLFDVNEPAINSHHLCRKLFLHENGIRVLFNAAAAAWGKREKMGWTTRDQSSVKRLSD